MGRKIIEIMKERMDRNEKFFSFEFFPPKTEEVSDARLLPVRHSIREMRWFLHFNGKIVSHSVFMREIGCFS